GHCMKRSILCVLLSAVMLTGCGTVAAYGEFPAQEKSTLTPVGNWNSSSDYEGVEAIAEPTAAVYSSADGLCTIEAKAHYYDVTLDLTKGDHFAVGAAYAETILQLPLSYEEYLEEYLYENLSTVYRSEEALIEAGAKADGKYDLIIDRIRKMKAAANEAYQQEMNGFASRFSGGDSGFVQDGKLSRDEADLVSLVPDVLRETACSALAVDGSRSASGKPMVARLMEWDLGKESKMCDAHCVVHFRNGDRSLTSVASLGQLDVITGLNDNGVFAADLDVGSRMESFSCEGKIPYTFAMREGLETCTSAAEMAAYMNSRAALFTYNHNVMITDEHEAMVAEDCHDEPDGVPLIRKADTPLLEGLTWDAPGCLCAVNAFAAKGQYDQMTANKGNILRWVKYDRLFAGEEKLSLARFKSLMTSEKADSPFLEIRSDGLVFMTIVDYDTRTLQAAFTSREGIVDTPDFLLIDTF
ncbi:MAG: hypothetical protein IK107_02775, partial [Oscillospiraceae bacterium]|nr:hypothetical protein [Oscillospiraceae bacterium]